MRAGGPARVPGYDRRKDLVQTHSEPIGSPVALDVEKSTEKEVTDYGDEEVAEAEEDVPSCSR